MFSSVRYLSYMYTAYVILKVNYNLIVRINSFSWIWRFHLNERPRARTHTPATEIIYYIIYVYTPYMCYILLINIFQLFRSFRSNWSLPIFQAFVQTHGRAHTRIQYCFNTIILTHYIKCTRLKSPHRLAFRNYTSSLIRLTTIRVIYFGRKSNAHGYR
jgi:hypothetical protein